VQASDALEATTADTAKIIFNTVFILAPWLFVWMTQHQYARVSASLDETDTNAYIVDGLVEALR
jgi:hypothetical protein